MAHKKVVLVTGGAGFIGSNICEKLLEKDYSVVCLDNLSTGRTQNIEDFLSHPQFNFIEGDIRNLETCEKVCEGVNYILHQAALGSVPRSINNPIISNDVNVGGFLNMLVAAKNAGIERFIYAASSSTYGDAEFLPKIEDRIGKPLSPYAITKYVNELYAEMFKKIYNLDTIGLRYFNVFGRKQAPNGAYAAVIPKFIQQLLNYQSPVIYGDGTFSRDFTHVDNVVEMNISAMEVQNETALNQIYNSAAGGRRTIREMAEKMREILSQYDPKIADVEIKYEKERIGDVPHSQASIEKAKKLLNYRPTYDFEKGLEKTIAWFWEEKRKLDDD